MAGYTRCGQMSAIQYKITLVVLLNRKSELSKTFHAMAFITIPDVSLLHQLSPVVIVVAIGATTVQQFFGIAAGMACIAINPPVLPFQRIVGQVVVKSINVFDFMKRFFGMAGAAIVSKFVIVHILMAGIAICKTKVGKLLKSLSVADRNFMTFGASYLLMAATEGKFRLVVPEKFCRNKSLHSVAVETIVRKRFLMIISVAGEAIFSQPQPGFTSFFELLRMDIFLLMAPATFHFTMRTQ
jgi:hypothetical protein